MIVHHPNVVLVEFSSPGAVCRLVWGFNYLSRRQNFWSVITVNCGIHLSNGRISNLETAGLKHAPLWVEKCGVQWHLQCHCTPHKTVFFNFSWGSSSGDKPFLQSQVLVNFCHETGNGVSLVVVKWEAEFKGLCLHFAQLHRSKRLLTHFQAVKRTGFLVSEAYWHQFPLPIYLKSEGIGPPGVWIQDWLPTAFRLLSLLQQQQQSLVQC